METILHHDTLWQPVERGIQTCFRKNMNHSSANHTSQAGQLENSKHL